MANFFENNKDRNLIPNWRAFQITIGLGELSSGLNKVSTPHNFQLSEGLIADWKNSKSIGVAADLVSNAFILAIKDSSEVMEASAFILSNIEKSSPTLTEIANSFVADQIKKEEKPILDIPSIEQFKELSNLQFIFGKISSIKKNLIDNPRNAVGWAELSRLYLILGQTDQSRTSMLNAFSLANDNRFIIRSLVRLLANLDEADLAHDILRKSAITRFDPWLISAEIAFASKRERHSRFIKPAIELINSQNFSAFSTSELLSALGTLELKSGSHKKSKDFFMRSLISPTDNSLAQAEWATQKDRTLGDINPEEFNIKNSFEAMARDSFQKENWDNAMNYIIKWFLDMPYSRRPILMGSHIASNFLKDQQKAVDLCKAGLISHPNDFSLLNNIIYALCLDNRLEEAKKYIDHIEALPIINEVNQICITATKGLYFFRMGFPDVGRSLYQEAIELAKKCENRYLFNLAVINYTREEILCKSVYVDTLVQNIDQVIKGEVSKNILLLKKDVIDLYNKQKQ